MELSYWQSRWQNDNTGWHMNQVYPLLPDLWPRLSIKANAQVLVPLCGKSLDMKWLAEQGCQVTGVEISRKALKEFMEGVLAPFSTTSSHGFAIYKSKNIILWEGDFLKLPATGIATPDLIYDKASMVALPPDLRNDYAQKVLSLCSAHTKILLQTFEYKQAEMTGPPFSVDEKEIREYFGKRFFLQQLHEQSKIEELNKFQRRGLSSYLLEKVFLLQPR